MKLKIVFSICIFTICSLSLFSQKIINAEQAKIDSFVKNSQKMTSEDFRNYYKKSNKRVPDVIQKAKVNAIVNKIKDNKKKSQNNELESLNLPGNIIYPGEFEEVKAIMITWPYNTYDTTGHLVDGQFFDNIGIYFEPLTQSVIFDRVYSVIDTFQTSEISRVFSKLANAIDNETEVWINVWKAEDTTALIDFMGRNSIPLKHAKFYIYPGNSFWYRDCGPIAFYYGKDDEIGFLDLQYYTGRPLDDSIPIQIARQEGYKVFTTTLGYEGGNILLDGLGNLFTSTAVYDVNNTTEAQFFIDSTGEIFLNSKDTLTPQQVDDSLKYLLNLNRIRVMPSLVNDGGTGHIDLYADMYDENYFIFSQYPLAMSKFADFSIASKNIDTIMTIVRSNNEHYRKFYIPFPKKDNGAWYNSAQDYEQYTRSYSNHLILNKSIIQPVFADSLTGDYQSMMRDLDSIKTNYPGYKIVPIDVRSFDGFGGAIHCITKQIPADNPIRIYHQPFRRIVSSNKQYKIEATMYNKSGIDKSICYWRYKGETKWNELNLSKSNGSDLFDGIIQNNTLNGNIEYYLTAKSVNGKTISKPFTAPEGYYSFEFSTSVDVKDNLSNSTNVISEFYPNPANEQTLININSIDSGINVNIYNISGIPVYSNNFSMIKGFDALAINTSSFIPGTYLVTFRLSNGSIYNRTLIVSK
jgi:agmatine/peptidylarginine deiminase